MARRKLFTDLPIEMIDREHAAIFVSEFIVWWHQAGHLFYGTGKPQEDAGLQHFFEDAIEAAGGPVLAKRIIDATKAAK